jgi:hypothetical protein
MSLTNQRRQQLEKLAAYRYRNIPVQCIRGCVFAIVQ